MVKQTLTIPAILESLQSLKDKTWKVRFETNELQPGIVGGLSQLQGEYCYVAIKKEPFKSEELEQMNQLKADFDDQTKSPSQRLRGVMYYLWEADPEGYDDFQMYYRFKMEKIITHYKNILDEKS